MHSTSLATDLLPLESVIESAWEVRETLNTETSGDIRDAVEQTLRALDSGTLRVAEKQPDGQWQVHQWVKKAVLLYFRLHAMQRMSGGPALVGGESCWWDKVPSKFEGWQAADFAQAGFRAVPNCAVRHSAYIAPNVVLMPSFVNVGAYVGEGSMIDTWATVGSCAQIGKHCHISGGVGIGGVLEPLQANPVIIEDGCFIGARSEIAEGVIVEEGAVIAMGVYLGASTKIIDRETGETFKGRIPSYSVVVPGALPAAEAGKPSLYCAVIVKRVDEQTRAKTGINDLLREAVS